VGEEMAKGDRTRGWAKFGAAGGWVEAVEHLRAAEFGEKFFGGLVEGDLLLCDQLEGGGGGDGFGHRRDGEDGVDFYGRA